MLRLNDLEKQADKIHSLLSIPGASRVLHAVRLHGVIIERDIAARTLVPHNLVRDIMTVSEDVGVVVKCKRGVVTLYSLTPLGAEAIVGSDVVKASVMRQVSRESEVLPEDEGLDSSVRRLLAYYREASVPAREDAKDRIGQTVSAIRRDIQDPANRRQEAARQPGDDSSK
jgi:hypothetical protein